MTTNRQGKPPAIIPTCGDSTTGESGTNLVTLGAWLSTSAQRISHLAGVPFSAIERADLRIISAKVLGASKTYLMAHPEMQLTADQHALLEANLQRLLDGEALPYVLGEWEFYGRMFKVTPDVLIPRPETELMIENVISWLKEHKMTTTANSSVEAGPFVCADVGTGSGCIAISLALEVPEMHIIATDISLPALHTARLNVLKHGVQQQLDLVQADLLSAFAPSSFNILCANLPYIPSARLPHLAVAHHEPLLALDGGLDGLDLIARLIPQAIRLLTSGGLALLEIDDTHTEAILDLAQKNFAGCAKVINDYQDKPRLLKLEKSLG